MPEKKHVRGVGEKEQRMYEHIRKEAETEGRYGKRAEEVSTHAHDRPLRGRRSDQFSPASRTEPRCPL